MHGHVNVKISRM